MYLYVIYIYMYLNVIYIYMYLYIAKCKSWSMTTHVGRWSLANLHKDLHTTINYVWIPILGWMTIRHIF